MPKDAKDLRLPTHGDVRRGQPVAWELNGEQLSCFEGETVAGALMALGQRTFRHTFRLDLPRGLYCGMGVCYDCLVVVDGVPNTRACMTYVTPRMRVKLQHGWGDPDAAGVEST